MNTQTTKNGSLKVFKRYRDMLSYVQAQYTESKPTSLQHLKWMCEHCINKIETNDEYFNVFKISRWLGFVQGVLATKEIISVTEEREVTRPWLSDKNNARYEELDEALKTINDTMYASAHVKKDHNGKIHLYERYYPAMDVDYTAVVKDLTTQEIEYLRGKAKVYDE